MRLDVPLPCFFRGVPFAEAVRTVKQLGYEAIETYNWKDLDPAEVQDTLDETGIEFLSMCTTDFRMTDPMFRKAWLEGLEESCEAAVQMRVSRLITQVGPDTGASREEQHVSIVDALLEARPILDRYGITIMVEPLNTYVNHPGYYLTSSAEAFDIIRTVDHPLVKVVYDIYHQQIMEGNIIPSILNNMDCIAHLHSAGHPGRHELQLGENDYKVIFKAVDEAGYKGWCGLEYNPLMDPVESLKLTKELYG
ncbi:MAG: TIM barrel protein [Clostridiales bacterium]|nr:TIM barrel protein [Clostridiales bacterium]